MTNDLFEEHLRGELRERLFSSHPSFAKLLSYAQREELEASERRRASAHIVSCRRCQEELATIRAELAALERALPQLGRAPTFSLLERLRALGTAFGERLWGRPALYGHVVAYATAVVILIVLNLQQFQTTQEPGYQGGGGAWWVQGPLLAWGAVLLWHGYRVWRRR